MRETALSFPLCRSSRYLNKTAGSSLPKPDNRVAGVLKAGMIVLGFRVPTAEAGFGVAVRREYLRESIRRRDLQRLSDAAEAAQWRKHNAPGWADNRVPCGTPVPGRIAQMLARFSA